MGTLKDETKQKIVESIIKTSMTYPPDIKLPDSEGIQKLKKII